MAKAKKKTAVKKSRVSPAVPNINPDVVKYEDLANGECFIYKSCLYMKWDYSDQEAFDLNGEGMREDLCDEIVIPVDINVTWKNK